MKLLDAALDYARRGWPVFPCNPATKRPYTKHGFKDAACDEEQIRRWWKQWPHAMIGVPTGTTIGAFALDPDRPEKLGEPDGEAALQELERQYGKLPPTHTHITPGGRRHLLFAIPEGLQVTNSKGSLPPGIDVRGDGGYIIVPPSMRQDSRAYEIEEPLDYFHFAPPPDWLVSMISTPRMDHKAANQTETTQEVRESVEAALRILPNNYDRDGWVRIGAAYFEGGGIFDGFDAWSRQHPSYDRAETEKAWMSFAKFDRISVATLFYEASQRVPGWQGGAQLENELKKGASKTLVSILPVDFYELEDETAIPPRQWLFGRHYIRGYASLTIAPGGSGKSALVIAEALSMATGKRVLHHTPRKPLRVWPLNLEDPEEEIRRRVVAIAKHFGICKPDLEGRLILTSGRELELKIAKSERGNSFALDENLIRQVVQTIREKGIDVLIIDPLVSSHYVSENDNMAMDAVIKAFSSIAGQTGCAIEIVHHVRKPSTGHSGEMTADDARGASAVIGAARSVRLLQKMTEDEASQSGVKERWRHFRTVDAKANLAPPAENSTWYKIESVELANGNEDHDDDSVGVVVPWSYSTLTEALPSDIIEQVQNKIRGGEYRYNSQSDDWVGYAIGRICGLDPDDKGQRKKLGQLIRKWVESDVLRKVSRPDKNREWRDFVEVPGEND
jgi:hypothetical protein